MATTAAVLVLTVVLAIRVVGTSRSLGGSTAHFEEATLVLTNVANVHREVQQLRAELEPWTAASDDRLATGYALLRNQLRVLEVRGESMEHHRELLGDVRQKVDDLGQLVAGVQAAAVFSERSLADLRVRLTALELDVKHLYDAHENHFFGSVSHTLDAKDRSQRTLGVLAALTVSGGLALGGGLWRRARGDLRSAYVALIGEIEERRAAEVELRDSEERFRALVQNSSDVTTVVDRDSTVRHWSASARTVLGIASEATGAPYVDHVVPDDRASVAAAIQTVDPAGPCVVEYRVITGEGACRTMESIVSDMTGISAVRAVVLNTRDVTDRREFEQELTRQAFRDHLTGLANRALFADRLSHAIRRAGRTGAPVSVLAVDLDGFKLLNDSHGHAVGDALLVDVAARLRGCVRDADTVARLGGDEFAILLDESAGDPAAATADRVVEAIARPFVHDMIEIRVTASVGISTRTSECEDADRLQRDADLAMYAAKRDGKSRARAFEPSMRERMVQRVELEAELRAALERGELTVHYQPTVDMASRRVVGVEALARWHSPERGEVPPLTFVPVAEESGLIVPLGRLILSQACAEGVRWVTAEGPPIWLAVNVSPLQLRYGGFVDDLFQVLDESGFPSSQLVLEVTESIFVDSATETYSTLQAVRRAGVRIAIDDFGTGYSSLSYLRELPVDVLKVDRTFIRNIHLNREEAALTQAIVEMGHNLHLEIVAEGVEVPAQARELLGMRCKVAQGFLFAKPMPARELDAFLQLPNHARA